MYSPLNPYPTPTMRHNGIKLPPASLAHDHYHGVGLCPVLSVRYSLRADMLPSV